METLTNKNQKISTVIPQNQQYELELAIANLITKHFQGERVSQMTNENIKQVMNASWKILEVEGNIKPSAFVPTPRFKFAQLEPFKLYKNVNTYSDQWYMKVVESDGKQKLITGSRYSKYQFNESSATLEGAVFIPFETDITER